MEGDKRIRESEPFRLTDQNHRVVQSYSDGLNSAETVRRGKRM